MSDYVAFWVVAIASFAVGIFYGVLLASWWPW